MLVLEHLHGTILPLDQVEPGFRLSREQLRQANSLQSNLLAILLVLFPRLPLPPGGYGQPMEAATGQG
jgi:hypothetical protein